MGDSEMADTHRGCKRSCLLILSELGNSLRLRVSAQRMKIVDWKCIPNLTMGRLEVNALQLKMPFVIDLFRLLN